MLQYSAQLNVSIQKVWEHLLYKIDHPQYFVPGVSDVVILEKTATYVMRKMKITMPNGVVNEVHEKITFKPYKVRFLLIDHPKFEGYVDNDAVALSDSETQLTYTMNWTDKATGLPHGTEELIKSAVLKSVEHINTAQL